MGGLEMEVLLNAGPTMCKKRFENEPTCLLRRGAEKMIPDMNSSRR